MNCPQCGGEMERGCLYAGRPLLWTPNPRKRTPLPGRADVSLRDTRLPDVWICKACRRVVVAY